MYTTYKGTMLVDKILVGKNLENFSFRSETIYNAEGVRMFGNVNSGEFFRKTEKEIHKKWGDEVNALLIRIYMDKSYVDRSGAIKIWPCYMGIGNFTTEVNASINALYFVGFCPMMDLTDAQLNVDFKKAGITAIENLKEANKMLRKYIENEYIRAVIQPIIHTSINGPILLAVGAGENLVIKKFMPVFERYICK